MSLIQTLQVRKDHLATCRVSHETPRALREGQIRVRTDVLALTANNITYAAFGDAMHYWDFFPSGAEGWGIVPLWGFASVVQSLHPGVAVGERIYGYWPFASHAVIEPLRLTEHGFVDGASHRASLPAVYNQYLRSNIDPQSQQAPHGLALRDWEAVQALLRPLFVTAWLIDDFFADAGFFGAQALILSSASSKTASATAHHLAQRAGVQVIGLTSPAQRAYCQSLGCYHQVLSYDELAQLPASLPCAYIDFAGNNPLRREIHERFAQLRYDCSIGGTHVEQLGSARELPGPRATLFFAPAQVKKRLGDWGGAVFQQRSAEAWHTFARRATQPGAAWIQPVWRRGGADVQDAYAQVLAGRLQARQGLIIDLGTGS